MEIIDDKNFMPLGVGSELSADSFKVVQYSNTYLLAAPRYYTFYASYIKPLVGMYTGWIEGFHNLEYGVIPTKFLQKIGNGIKSLLFSNPVVLNSYNPDTNNIIDTKFKKKSNFDNAKVEAYDFCEAGGTGLLKLNRDGNGDLRFEAIPMDKFFIEVDGYGDIERVKCFIATYHDTISSTTEYHLCEERFFKYTTIGSVKKRFPMVHYTVYQTTTNITYDAVPTDPVRWADVPPEVRNSLKRDYGEIDIDKTDAYTMTNDSSRQYATMWQNCTLLPFDDDLGVRLIKFTRNIPSFPKMPFGMPLADFLQNELYQYEQLKFFERVEVYTARARVMMDDCNSNPNDPEERRRALDPIIFNYYENLLNGEKDGKPLPIQPELRADEIKTQKQNILNDTAAALGLSSTTIASWLSDGTTQKSATEIKAGRSNTETFIKDKIGIISQPLQDLIDIYFHYYGVEAPEMRIMPVSQEIQAEEIQQYAELYDGGKVTARMLAEKILGTNSYRETKDLEEFIISHSNKAQMPMSGGLPQKSGAAENPKPTTQNTNATLNKTAQGGLANGTDKINVG